MARGPTKTKGQRKVQTQGERPRGLIKRSRPALRRSVRVAEAQKAQAISSARRNPLPSPPLSNTRSKEPRNLQHLPSSSIYETAKPPRRPELHDTGRGRKRKRPLEDHASDTQSGNGFPVKRPRALSLNCPETSAAATAVVEHNEDHSTEHWIDSLPLPTGPFDKAFNMSQQTRNLKRSSSTKSYSQSVKDGEKPVPWSTNFEKEILEPAGIVLTPQSGERAIGDDARDLCQTLLDARYDPPKDSLFEGDRYQKLLSCARNAGEGNVVRDLQQYVCPSADHLIIRGELLVDYMKEAVKGTWCVVSVAGPNGVPDVTGALTKAAFSEAELERLIHNTSTDTPTKFLGDMFFPIWTCEAKSGGSGLEESDRQNARSAATAINSIVGLYRQGEENRRKAGIPEGLASLHRQILYFSISHDHTTVRIYGHYPFFEPGKTWVYRHLVKSVDLSEGNGGSRWVPYCIVRKMYDYFAPIHRQRISDAISFLPEPTVPSSVSADGVGQGSDAPSTQDVAASPQTPVFKKPRRPTTSASENARVAMLEEQMEKMSQERERERQEMSQERERERQEMSQERERERQEVEELKRMLAMSMAGKTQT